MPLVTTAAPERGTTAEEQRNAAREIGNRIRLARSCRRRAVEALEPREGERLVAELLRDPPPELLGADVLVVLGWIRRASRTLSLRRLRAAGVTSELVKVRDLTDRQRRVLAAACTRELTPDDATHARLQPAEALAYLESLPPRGAGR